MWVHHCERMFVGFFFSHKTFAQSFFSEQFLILAAELEGAGILKQSSERLVFSPLAWLSLILLALEVAAGFELFALLELHHQLILVPVNFLQQYSFFPVVLHDGRRFLPL